MFCKTSTKIPLIPASSIKSEGYVYKIVLDKREKIKQKCKIHDIVRVADLKKLFQKEIRLAGRTNTTNWSYKLYKIIEVINDRIPSYRIENSSERYNEALLKKSQLTLKENKDIPKALTLN